MKIALVLTGGGAAGIRHVAVLRAMTDLGLLPQFIIGASAGALCASGYSWVGIEGLEEMWFSIKSESDVFYDRFWIQFPWSTGMKTADPLRKKVKGLFEKRKPGGVPFQVVCADLVSQQPRYFDQNHADIVNRVVASASIPIVVNAYVPEGCKLKDGMVTEAYVDGGTLENCPIQGALDQKPDLVIVSHCFPKGGVPQMLKLSGPKDIILGTVDCMTMETYRGDVNVCQMENPVPIENLMPPVATIDTMEFNQNKIKAAYFETYSRTMKELASIKAKYHL
jgi:NTE family protein